MKSYRRLKNALRGRAILNEPLSKHTSFGIGGPAKIWVEPESECDLREALSIAGKKGLKIFVMGGGTKVLADSKGYKGMVISLRRGIFRDMKFDGVKVTVGAGANLPKLILDCTDRSLAGPENLAGIPGTVGGAVFMNSGYKKNIGDFITSLKVMDRRGRIKIIKRKNLKFSYRKSGLAPYIIIEAELKLKKSNKDMLKEKYNFFLKARKESQPWGVKSAGCVFKNSKPGISAGFLIEKIGLKGKKHGGARISKKHANFIINSDKADSRDIIYLMNLAKRNIREKFNIKLEPELIVM